MWGKQVFTFVFAFAYNCFHGGKGWGVWEIHGKKVSLEWRIWDVSPGGKHEKEHFVSRIEENTVFISGWEWSKRDERMDWLVDLRWEERTMRGVVNESKRVDEQSTYGYENWVKRWVDEQSTYASDKKWVRWDEVLKWYPIQIGNHCPPDIQYMAMKV